MVFSFLAEHYCRAIIANPHVMSSPLLYQVPVPIVFRGPNGASAGVAAQHSQDFSSWYGHCPGLKVGVALLLVRYTHRDYR